MVAARACFLQHEIKTFGTPPQEGRGQLFHQQPYFMVGHYGGQRRIPGRFVAKDDGPKFSVAGYLATQAQTVYVSRNRGIKGNSAKIAGVIEALKNGDTVTIFPEGTSTEGREIPRSNPAFFRRPMMQAY